MIRFATYNNYTVIVLEEAGEYSYIYRGPIDYLSTYHITKVKTNDIRYIDPNMDFSNVLSEFHENERISKQKKEEKNQKAKELTSKLVPGCTVKMWDGISVYLGKFNGKHTVITVDPHRTYSPLSLHTARCAKHLYINAVSEKSIEHINTIIEHIRTYPNHYYFDETLQAEIVIAELSKFL